MTSIYIHVPFCARKCRYCDFVSYVGKKEEIVKKYFEYLLREISLNPPRDEIESIFIGGGTPSYVDEKYIGMVLKKLREFKLKNEAEITIETNPNSLTEKKLQSYMDFGINRISMGVQTTNEKILKYLGRVHNNSDVKAAVGILKKFDFKNYNLDFMMSLPEENLEDVKKNLEVIKILNPPHISYYSLILEDGTPLMDDFYKNRYHFPDEDSDRDIYRYIVSELKNLSYNQYEISNFSKEGYECKHNLNYWRIKDYIGYGVSASSNFLNKRTTNTSSLEEYFEKIDKNEVPISFREFLTNSDRLNEYMIMGLRLNEGINLLEAKERFKIDLEDYYKESIKKNLKYKTINFLENRIFLTEHGRDISNIVELDFMK